VLTWRVVWQDFGRLPLDPARELEMIEAMKSGGYDGAVVLTSFKQTPHPAGYACYLAGIPLRLGESKEWGGGVLTDELPAAPDGLHQAERNLRLVEHAGFRVRNRALDPRVPEEARTSVAVLLQGRGATPGSPYLLLNPWTSARSRNYPTDRFALAARRIAEKTGWPVVVSGTEADRERGRALLGLLGDRGVDLIGSTDLAGLAALVEGANLLLTSNTSTMHIADALRTPEVVLFAGTELEEQWRPRDTPYRLLRRETSCSPCYAFTCPYAQECLDIPPGEVAEAGLSLLSEVEVQA
jgi:ADP-heptose:LPS heptosyltransferase